MFFTDIRIDHAVGVDDSRDEVILSLRITLVEETVEECVSIITFCNQARELVDSGNTIDRTLRLQGEIGLSSLLLCFGETWYPIVLITIDEKSPGEEGG